MSELGEVELDVKPFFLDRFPVTNEQYLQFVQATNHRFPFHWWKEGRKDDWSERRGAARFKRVRLRVGVRLAVGVVLFDRDNLRAEELDASD